MAARTMRLLLPGLLLLALAVGGIYVYRTYLSRVNFAGSVGAGGEADVRVPPGFALTTHGYARFMRDAGVSGEIPGMLAGCGHDAAPMLQAALGTLAFETQHTAPREHRNDAPDAQFDGLLYRQVHLLTGLQRLHQ